MSAMALELENPFTPRLHMPVGEIRELSEFEIDYVTGGDDALAALGAASGVLGVAALAVGAAALVPGPHSLPCGAAALGLGAASAGLFLAAAAIDAVT